VRKTHTHTHLLHVAAHSGCESVCVFQRLRSEVEATQTGWDKYISQVSSEMVVKDTEIIALHQRETKFHAELGRSRKETERLEDTRSRKETER